MKKNILTCALVFAILTNCTPSKEDNTHSEPDTPLKQEQAADPLPSWNEGVTKKAIIDFVEKTTNEGSTDFVEVKNRIATFDNDGNLWSEQPLYFQLIFAMDRIKAMAEGHPEWKNEEPYKSILEGNVEKALAGGTKSILALVMASHAGMTTDEFNQEVNDWLATAKHPKTGKPFNEMIYQPMVELLDYLRANDYKTFIVSGGGVDFMRAWVEEAYGIPPHQVIGSSNKVKYEVSEDGTPTLIKQAELNFIDDKEGKPVGIHQYIGMRPVFASGNSDGDYQMLEYTMAGNGPRFGLLLHHTDSIREFAYDRESHIGQLNKGLDDAEKMGWTVIDMKKDWKKVYHFEK
ncbi:HAD family hydrolase [Owenweeksia hongkongensis]|uniref:HAD family hydrolase n=1 Tax=Owenweeksia hongkongensis TaxID=253245 RepID=UPI003A94BFEF